jgi:hypothetical protein
MNVVGTNTHGYAYDEGPLTPQETIPVKLGESYKTRFANENLQVRIVYFQMHDVHTALEESDLDS